MRTGALVVAALVTVTACATASGTTTTRAAPPTTVRTTTTSLAAPPPTAAPTTTAPAATTTTSASADPHSPPTWLGARALPLRADGYGVVAPTPPELVDRAFRTPDLLPPPISVEFVGTSGPIPAEVLARSTWTPACPVTVEELAYVVVTHWGFDGRHHTGELIVNADHAAGIVEVFRELHDSRFPIEEMRVIRSDELEIPPTGDGNVTTSFVCRPAVGSGSWSMHAHGLAIDINPFHNPYLRGDLVLPELASYYVDRDIARPGMILESDVVVTAFERIGWHWGGRWNSLDDWMHFSSNNR